MNRADWVYAPRTEQDQCTQKKAKNFPNASDPTSGVGYLPDDQVLQDLSDITGGVVTVEELRSLQILSGIEAGDQASLSKALGQWCSMPAPNTGDQGIFPERQAVEYWQKCVMPHAGFFNVLVCSPPGSNFSAQIGLMAMNQDVCYPLHAHVATEVYWQVSGKAVWRTWEDCSNHTAQKEDFEKKEPNIWPHDPPDGKCLVSGPLESWESADKFSSEFNSSAWHQKNAASGEWEYKGPPGPHYHPSPVVHETDTTATGTTHVLNFYLWAKSDGDENQYHTGLGYFDMHRVFETLNNTNGTNGTKPDRDDRARKLIGTCATKEQIPSIFHEEWQPNLHQWLSPLTNWTPPAVQCPARRLLPPSSPPPSPLLPPPPPPPAFPPTWDVTEWELTRDAIIKSLEAVTFFPDGDDSGPGTLALTDPTVVKQMKGVPGRSQG